MVPANELALFALTALGLVLTPRPNMMYLISRSIMQGRPPRSSPRSSPRSVAQRLSHLTENA